MEAVLGDTIIAAVADRLDLPAFTTSTKPTLVKAQGYVRESALALTALMRTFSGEDHFTAIDTIATTANLSLLPMAPASPFYGLRRIAWQKSASETVDLVRAQVDDWKDDGNGWNQCDVPKYRLLQNAFEFYPTPRAVHTLRIYYLTAIDYVVGSFSLNAQNLDLGWQEWIVCDVCCKIRPKQEKGMADFAGQRALAWQTVAAASSRRDAFGIQQVRDLRGANRRSGFFRRF